MRLNQATPSASRRRGGVALIALLMSMSGLGARAAAPPSAAADANAGGMYQLAMTIDVDGAVSSPRLRVRAGEPFAVAVGEGASRWSAASALMPDQGGHAMMKFVVKRGDKVIAAPGVMVKLGETAKIVASSPQHVDDYAITLVVTPVSRLTP